MERIYNLIDEPWIRVLNMQYETEEVSLRTLFEKAHLFRTLDGEIETQNLAVLRLLVAILYSIFERYDINGNSDEIETEDMAVERWQSIWELKKFPISIIDNYLGKYHNRFWLFDEERPFYQVLEAGIGTYNSAAKLNGVIAESNNKKRMFSERAGIKKDELTFSESARWLIYINGFDDTAAKPKGKNLPSPGAGWLGRIGLIYADGETLFSTLMLNLTLLKDGQTMWEPIDIKSGNCACWELEQPRTTERSEMGVPKSIAALYTLQSRRVLLRRENNSVLGYYLLGGDFFSRENAFEEQMTMWRSKTEKEKTVFLPRRHDPARQIWREFSSITALDNKDHRPGIVSWLSCLNKIGIISGNINMRITSVQYGDKDFFVTDSYTDILSFHSQLLGDKGEKWRQWIDNEIQLCDKCAYAIKNLSEDLMKAAGDSGTVSDKGYRELFYTRLDPEFRKWLVNLQPDKHDELYLKGLRTRVKQIAFKLGQEMVTDSGERTFRGRYMMEKEDKTDRMNHYSAPEAYNYFLYRINKIYERS